jgi:hypothetical protein
MLRPATAARHRRSEVKQGRLRLGDYRVPFTLTGFRMRIAHLCSTAVFHPRCNRRLDHPAVPPVSRVDHPYRFLIHDRDGIFSSRLDAELNGFGVHVLKTPPRTPTANAFCERLIGTIRRECLDYLIPINERHLRKIVNEFVCHYNRGRPHSSLGPGIP